MKLTAEERETIINYDESTDTACVFTCNTALRNRIKKYMTEHPDEVTMVDDDDCSSDFKLPKKWIKVRPPKQMSEEAKKAAAERMREYWDNKNTQ